MKLSQQFYINEDVVTLARKMLGKYLFTNIDSHTITGGLISETEAYAGINDKASHAYNNKRTKRTNTMYMEGGIAYVYLCYGIHALFNIVTNDKNEPHAILVRGIIPTHGLDKIKQRTGYNKITKDSLNGPGKVTKALGINTSHDKTPLTENKIWIENSKITIPEEKIITTKRIGIDYAGKDALLPYRFILDYKYDNLKKNNKD